jgi:hypothetical protein
VRAHHLLRPGLALLATVAVATIGGGTAGAQAQPEPGFSQTWALSPTGDNPGEPSSRPSLTYNVAPGGTIDDSVTLWNYSSVPVQFRIVATDAYNNATGDFALLRSNQRAKDLGSWIQVGTSSLSLPARTSASIPIKITVPPDASPGDHAAAVLASSDTITVDDQGNEVALDRRIGPRVYLRVAGPVVPDLSVEELSSKYVGGLNPLGGTMEVEYTVRNEGNVRMGARHRVVVKDIFGRTVGTERMRPIAELLPGNTVTYQASVDGVPATLRAKATVQVEPVSPQGVDEAPAEPVSASSTAWAVPWSLLLVLVVAYALWRLYRRWRERDTDDDVDDGLPPRPPVDPRVPEPIGG